MADVSPLLPQARWERAEVRNSKFSAGPRAGALGPD